MGNAMDCTNVTTSASEASADTTGADSPSWYWIAGMGLTILSSVAVSLGTVLQKKAHLQDLEKPPAERAPRKAGLLFSKMWLCGFLMMALLQIPLTFAALALAAQSLVIPLGAGSTIVLTQILAVCILKEPMGRVEVGATLLIIVGVILTTGANAGSDKTLSPCGILARYTESDFLIPLLVLLFSVSFSAVLLHWSPNFVPPRFQPALFAFIAGGLGAILNIMLKVVGEFTEGALAGDQEAKEGWSTVHPYYHLVAVFVMAVGMISFINQGLERFPAITFLPLYNCLFIVLSTFLGALFFREFDDFGTRALIMFPLGVVTTIFGIAIVSCSGREGKARGFDEEMEGFEMGRNRGPSDPLEQNYFDADISNDEKAYAEAPVMSRLVLI